MKEREIIKYMISEFQAKMPDIEQVRENCLNQSIGEKATKNIAQKKHKVLKPTKMLATAATLLLVIGLFNIQTVIAFISGLFFVPGIGITSDSNIIHYGLEKPIEINTEHGIFTLNVATKVTYNGKTDLHLLVETQDLPYHGWEKLNITFGLSAKDEILMSDEIWSGGGSASTNGVWHDFVYTYENFPNINEFELIVCEVKTKITLTNQEINYALSKENNGITMALSRLNGTNNLIYQAVFNSMLDYNEYSMRITGYGFNDNYYYDNNYEKISLSGLGGAGLGTDSVLIRLYNDILPEVKGFKAGLIDFSIGIKNPEIIEIPIPKDGERIKTNIEIAFGQYKYIITEAWRRGNSIFIEDNGISKVEREIINENKTHWFDSIQMIPNTIEYENAVANREAIIRSVYFDIADEAIISTRNGRMEIINFNENAEFIQLRPFEVTITQYGDFNVEFE